MKPGIYAAFALALSIGCISTQSSAGTIVGFGSPISALPGGTVIDFESTPLSSYSTLTIGNVTFTGDASFMVSSDYSGSYNNSGNSLQSPPGYPSEWRFDFASAVSGFAFNMGAHDDTWTLKAFNSANVLLDTLVISAIHSSNLGEFYGLTGSGIAYALLQGSGSDYILIDNFTYQIGDTSAVPVPAALPLFASGLGLLGLAGWRKRRKAAA